MNKYFLLSIVTCLLTTFSCNNNDMPITNTSGAKLDALMENVLTDNGLIGLSAAVVKGDALVWKGHYGQANIEEHVPVTDKTIFRVASLAKPLTALAILKLVEEDQVVLDEDINNYLPFDVRNPNFPDVPISLRHLLTHTSGISDQYMAEIALDVFFAVNEDHPMQLEEYCRSLLLPNGGHYHPSTFTNHAPGDMYEYSNVAVTLLGCVVEHVSGTSFEQFTANTLLSPLNLKSTSWHLADFDHSRFAMPYQADRSPYGLYTTPDFVSGGLNSNVEDLSKVLTLMINNGLFNGTQVFLPATIKEMKEIQYPDGDETMLSFQGLLWETLPLTKYTYSGHSGNMPGSNAYMFYEPNNNVGIVLAFNIDQEVLAEDVLLDLMDKMIEAGIQFE